MGILFSPELCWSAAKYKLVAQAKKAIYSNKSYQRNFGHFPYTEQVKLFDTMITPVLTYGSEIWGTS